MVVYSAGTSRVTARAAMLSSNAAAKSQPIQLRIMEDLRKK
jgi:hypothetical protein